MFDLDETLVHSFEILTGNEKADHILNFNLENGKNMKMGLNIRPFALQCL